MSQQNLWEGKKNTFTFVKQNYENSILNKDTSTKPSILYIMISNKLLYTCMLQVFRISFSPHLSSPVLITC